MNLGAQGEVRDGPPNKFGGITSDGLVPGERAARVTRERVRAVTGDATGVSATCATAQETCDSTSQTGSCLIVPRVARAGLRAPGCDPGESGWKDSAGGTEGAGARFWWCKGLLSTVPSSTSALKARVPDLGGV